MREEGTDSGETERCPEHPRKSLGGCSGESEIIPESHRDCCGEPRQGRASQSVGPKQCIRREIKLADWGMHEKKEEINRLENKIRHRWEGCVFFGKYVFKEVDYEV